MATRKTTTGSAPAPAQRSGKATKAQKGESPLPEPDTTTAPVPAAKSKVPKSHQAPAAATPRVARPAEPVAAGSAAASATTGATTPRPKSDAATQRAGVTPEQRLNYIEVAAYYIAERRGFAPGDPMADWLAAQLEIDQAIASGRLGRR